MPDYENEFDIWSDKKVILIFQSKKIPSSFSVQVCAFLYHCAVKVFYFFYQDFRFVAGGRQIRDFKPGFRHAHRFLKSTIDNEYHVHIGL